MHCYHTDNSLYELTLQIIYYHLSALGLRWEQIISGMCTIDWLLLQYKFPQLQWAKKQGNESLSAGAAVAHLNFSYTEDAEVLMSSVLGSEEEGSFRVYELSKVLENSFWYKTKTSGCLVSILNFCCGKRKENLQRECLHKTPALAQLQPINVAEKWSTLLLLKYDMPDTPKTLGTSSHSCEHGFTRVIAFRIKSKF